MGIPLSAIFAVAGIAAGVLGIVTMCGVVQLTLPKRIIVSILLVVLSAAFIFGSYWVYPKCPNCNSTQSSDFCTQCGTRIQEEYPVCPTCDITVKTDFCGQCGHDMRGE